ncbi:hypothetical protein [Streptomyces eurocidicus]|nr:hypothetical protein [Streptomyces eurocidicus]
MSENDRRPGDDTAATGLRLLLLPAFELSRHGRRLRLPAGAQRLPAFLALSDRPQHRAVVAGRLWADLPGDRSAAALRTTLWQMRRAAPDLVTGHGPRATGHGPRATGHGPRRATGPVLFRVGGPARVGPVDPAAGGR